MSLRKTRWTYQGYPCQGGTMDRKPGMVGDIGFLDLDVKTLKAILLTQPGRPWSAPNFREPSGPMMLPVAEIIRKGPGITIAEEPVEKGLRREGTLVMSTFDGDKPAGAPVTLRNVYLLPSGMDEILTDLNNAQAHNEGVLRVSVTDIRYFWDRYGTPLYGDYNVVLPNGSFDSNTVKGGDTPWTLRQMVNYIGLCLPGSPQVDGKVLDAMAPPVNQIFRHSPPGPALARLLSAYDLELHLAHDGNVWIDRRGATHQKNAFPATPKGPAVPFQDRPAVETKTVFSIDRPEAVTVAGAQREYRKTIGYVAAFIDVDGQIKRLLDIGSHWSGYSYARALGSATIREDKAWEDLPGGPTLVSKRKQIAARDFFKLFAPRSLFTKEQQSQGGAVATGTAEPYWNFGFQRNPLFPCKDPWWTPQELAEYADENVFPKKKSKANPDGVSLIQTPPIVKANLIRQAATQDAAPVIERVLRTIEVEQQVLEHFKERLKALSDQEKSLSQEKKPSDFEQAIRQTQALGGINIALAEGAEYAAGFLKELLARAAGAGPSITESKKIAKDQEKTNALMLEVNRAAINSEKTFIAQQIAKSQQAVAEQLAFIESIQISIGASGYFRGWINDPWGVVPQADFNLQPETGLLTFHEVVGIMKAPAVFDREDIELVSEGSVEVTVGCVKNEGMPTDQTAFTFIGSGQARKILLVESSKISAVKPWIVEDESIGIKENEYGQALNFDECIKKGAALAAPLLDQPDEIVGYFYEYEGMRKVATNGEINQVTWEFDGDLGITKITANFPDKINDAGTDSVARKRLKESVIFGGGA